MARLSRPAMSLLMDVALPVPVDQPRFAGEEPEIAAVLFMAAEEVPTLGRWVLGFMTQLLGSIGFVRMRNQ